MPRFTGRWSESWDWQERRLPRLYSDGSATRNFLKAMKIFNPGLCYMHIATGPAASLSDEYNRQMRAQLLCHPGLRKMMQERPDTRWIIATVGTVPLLG